MKSEYFINSEAINSVKTDFNLENLPVEYGSVKYHRYTDKKEFSDYFFSAVKQCNMKRGVFILVNPNSIHYASRSINSKKILTLFIDIEDNVNSNIKYEYVGLV